MNKKPSILCIMDGYGIRAYHPVGNAIKEAKREYGFGETLKPSDYRVMSIFNDYTCVFRCPNGSFPDDFVCQELIKDNINNKTCSIKKFFLGICDMKLKTLKQKQKFVERTNYEITNGDLYELIIEAKEKKKAIYCKRWE